LIEGSKSQIRRGLVGSFSNDLTFKTVLIKCFNPFGGSMYSWFRLGALLLAFVLNCVISEAQPLQTLSGTVPAGEVRTLVRDSLYRINGRYTIAGTAYH
jgi:hypothetical protein